MTPLEALQLLETVTAGVSGDRDTHVRIIEAIKLIGNELMTRHVQKQPHENIGLK